MLKAGEASKYNSCFSCIILTLFSRGEWRWSWDKTQLLWLPVGQDLNRHHLYTRLYSNLVLPQKKMKAIIYLRTSTTEQEPEKQKQDCLSFAKSKGYNVIKIYEEQLSGWKQIDRPMYNEIKEKARKGEIQAVIVWALDRWVRNRDTLIEDVTILKNYGCKIHSVKEAWLEAINIEGSLGRTIQDFLLGLMGSLAEMESNRKSERVKMAFQSHVGKKWGRPKISKGVEKHIINLHEQGVAYREICKQVSYWDASRNKKYVSMGFVHKTIDKYKRGELRI